MKPELSFSDAVREGIIAGRKSAIETARSKGTRLAIWRDGKVIEVTPEELDVLNGSSTSSFSI
jgi:hypothetical protein